LRTRATPGQIHQMDQVVAAAADTAARLKPS